MLRPRLKLRARNRVAQLSELNGSERAHAAIPERDDNSVASADEYPASRAALYRAFLRSSFRACDAAQAGLRRCTAVLHLSEQYFRWDPHRATGNSSPHSSHRATGLEGEGASITVSQNAHRPEFSGSVSRAHRGQYRHPIVSRVVRHGSQPQPVRAVSYEP